MASVGFVSATTGFPGGLCFRYAVESSPACVHPVAAYADGEIRVRLPTATVSEWANSEQVSIQGAQSLDDGNQLLILVEKEFACLAPRENEDESDMFPHPEAGSRTC